MLLGNLCLLANTLSMAVYYLLAKSLVQRYNPICVAAWAYVVAAICMGTTAATIVQPADWNVPGKLRTPLLSIPTLYTGRDLRPAHEQESGCCLLISAHV